MDRRLILALSVALNDALAVMLPFRHSPPSGSPSSGSPAVTSPPPALRRPASGEWPEMSATRFVHRKVATSDTDEQTLEAAKFGTWR